MAKVPTSQVLNREPADHGDPAMGYDPVVFRSVVLALVMGLTLQATGALSVIAPDDCVSAGDPAPDTPTDDCPDCLFCVCCSPLRPTIQASTIDLAPVESPVLSIDHRTPGLRDPDPQRILHVPRSA